MSKSIDDANAEVYQRDGAVCMRQLYTKQKAAQIAKELTAIYADYERKAAQEFTECPAGTKCGFADDGSPFMFFGPHSVAMKRRGTCAISLLSRDIPELRQMYDLPRLAERVGHVTGSRWIRHWQDEVFVKEPQQDNPTPWHHGVPAWPFKGDMVPNLWIALTDIAPNGGGLRIISGSHRSFSGAYPPPRDAHLELERGYSTPPDFDQLIADQKAEVKTWRVNAGDGVLLHPRTLHGALGNRSNTRRIAVSHRWLGENVRYAPDKYSVSDPLIDSASSRGSPDELFPVSWAA